MQQSPGGLGKRPRSQQGIAQELERAFHNDDDIHLDNLHHRKRYLTQVRKGGAGLLALRLALAESFFLPRWHNKLFCAAVGHYRRALCA